MIKFLLFIYLFIAFVITFMATSALMQKLPLACVLLASDIVGHTETP